MVSKFKLIKDIENWSNYDTKKNLTGLTDKQISLREKQTKALCDLEKERWESGKRNYSKVQRNALWYGIKISTDNS